MDNSGRIWPNAGNEEQPMKQFSRRDFLRMLALGAGSAAAAEVLAACGASTSTSVKTRIAAPTPLPGSTYLAAARGGNDPEALTRAAVEALGGIASSHTRPSATNPAPSRASTATRPASAQNSAGLSSSWTPSSRIGNFTRNPVPRTDTPPPPRILLALRRAESQERRASRCRRPYRRTAPAIARMSPSSPSPVTLEMA